MDSFGGVGGGEGGDEHEEGGFGEVEVGEEGVGDFEFERWVDEDAGAAGAGLPVCADGAFEDAEGGGADANNFSAAFFRGLDFLKCFGGNFVALFVHAMFFDRVGFDGREGSGADVEGDEGGFDVACF